jgi:hypothetical protein
MFALVHMVNEQHDNEQEWNRAYEEGRQLVREARVRRAEFKEQLRKQRLIYLVEAIGSMIVFAGIFFIVAVIILMR